MPSSVIKAFDYKEEHSVLTVTFVSGRRYEYYTVPRREYEALRTAFSKGSYFNRQIRDRYPCREADA